MSGRRVSGGGGRRAEVDRSGRRVKVAGAVLGLVVPTLLGLLTPAVQNWVLAHRWPIAGVTAVLVPIMIWAGAKEFAATEQVDRSLVPLDRAKVALAQAVLEQWKAEVHLRKLDPERRLAVDLTPTDRPVRSDPAGPEPRLRMTSATEAVEAYEGIPSRRCVILGGPRSGKTSAAVLLTLGLVRKWTVRSGEPVPVFISLADWKPAPGQGGLIKWLAGRLVEEYPGLANTGRYGEDAPLTLLRSGQVRPVLDGLDEIGEHGDEARSKALRAEAIKQIAEAAAWWAEGAGEPVGLILTCRAEQFEQAMRLARAEIWQARVVEIEPIALAEATAFIKHQAPPPQKVKWARTLDGLPASAPLARVLDTPLMIMLALEIYAAPGTEPEDLLALPGAADVERFLLNGIVERAFPDSAMGGQEDDWQGAKARRWLGFLARRMRDRGDLQHIKWWELPALVGRLERVLAGIAGAVIIGPPVGVGLGIVLNRVWPAEAAVASGAVVGAAFGVGLGWLSSRSMPPPAEMYFGKTGRLVAILISGGLVGVVGGAAGYLMLGTVAGMLEGAAMGIPIAAAYAGASTDATVRAATPRRLFRNDIVVALVFGLAYALPIGIVVAIALESPTLGALFGISCGLAGSLTYGLPWLLTLQTSKVGVIATVHLLLTQLTSGGRIPWKLLSFLEVAHQRGVLRRVGPVYQFSHVTLRDALAETPEPPAQRRGPVP